MAQRRTSAKGSNRLADEASPYLLQHAYNPVHWYPWGPEAFERARQGDKPIFLSIGYSTCHWCHVMEVESFEDQATAKILNDHFIAIKVDRETRPDVDETYMKAVQAMTGSGGWPLSVFLTPEGKPFYGGTYFPPHPMYGRPSFQQVLLAIAHTWQDKRQDLLGSARKIDEVLSARDRSGSAMPLSREIMRMAFAQFSQIFDKTYGGFGEAPKFPQPTVLTWMQGYWHRTADDSARRMVEATLDAMAAGGVYDHLGGGFHRYATDAQWLVPHFEKMLYDQALLGRAHIQAYQISGKEAYARVVREVFDYVLRDMTDSDGGFYSAEDADSEGREGVFYVWSKSEIQTLLGSDVAGLFARRYGVTATGNFEDGKNILHVGRTMQELSEEFGQSQAKIEETLAGARRRLFTERNRRIRPHRDDKIITAWNGLMISSMAYGGAVLAEERYIASAGRAADFVLQRLRVEGRLMRYSRAGRVLQKGFLDDYAFVILGLMDLYEATFEPRWLCEAADLADQMIALFSDDSAGGFFLVAADAQSLLDRDKSHYDGAIPSGNSIAALALLKLGQITGSQRFTQAGNKTLQASSSLMGQSPTGSTAMMQALDFSLGPTTEIVIAGSQFPDEARALIDEVRSHFRPDIVVLFHPAGPQGRAIEAIAPHVRHLGPVDGRAAAFVCQNYTCRRPVTDPEELRVALGQRTGGELDR